MAKSQNIIPLERIASRIYLIRGEKVMLDSDLAELYRVTTGNLNKATKRNPQRFPHDFMFQLTKEEAESLSFQIGTLKPRRRGQHRKYLPHVFTEQGVAMLSSVLRSPQAIAVNIQVMRAFVRMRELLSSNRELARQFAQLEARLNKRVGDHDKAIAAILSAIRQLMDKPVPKRRGIGFTANL